MSNEAEQDKDRSLQPRGTNAGTLARRRHIINDMHGVRQAGPRSLRDTRHSHGRIGGDVLEGPRQRMQRMRLDDLTAATVSRPDPGAQLLEVVIARK